MEGSLGAEFLKISREFRKYALNNRGNRMIMN